MSKQIKINKKTKINKKNVFKINIIFLVLFVVIGTGYSVMVNSISGKGYQIEKMESKLIDLRTNYENLTIDLSYKQSMNNLLANVDNLGMVEARNVYYITIPSTMVFNR